MISSYAYEEFDDCIPAEYSACGPGMQADRGSGRGLRRVRGDEQAWAGRPFTGRGGQGWHAQLADDAEVVRACFHPSRDAECPWDVAFPPHEGRATTSSMVSATRGCRSSTASCEGVCVALKSPLARGSGGLQPTKHLGSATAAYRTWRSSMWRSAGCATQKSSLETTCVKHTGTCYGASRILGASLRCRRCWSA